MLTQLILFKEIRELHPEFESNIKIGGVIGCKNDCYKPEKGLSVKDAEIFHSWQIDQLIKGGVDFIAAETLPSADEALGISKAIDKTGVPYIISFVISKDGNILDGTSLNDAINIIDKGTVNKPTCYAVICSYPTFLCADDLPKQIFQRLLGYIGNASSLDHSELEGSELLKSDSVSDWGNEMLRLNRSFGVKIMGGCCGTNIEHIQYLIEN